MITGLSAFALEFFVPCILQILSRRYCKSYYGSSSDTTFFSIKIISSNVLVVGVLVLGVAGLAFAITACVLSFFVS